MGHKDLRVGFKQLLNSLDNGDEDKPDGSMSFVF